MPRRLHTARSTAWRHPARTPRTPPVGAREPTARIVGRELRVDDLDDVVRIATSSTAAKLAKTFRLHPHRARTILAGAVLLREAAQALERPLVVVSAGMREGAAIALARSEAAAAA